MSYKQQFIRGVEVADSANKIQALLDRQNLQYEESDREQEQLYLPRLSIAGFRLPRLLENLGIFCVGSPGSGKTQALAKLISELRQREDFRIVCFDRNGEFTASFYRESEDLLFNPQDRRSLGWCHQTESASSESIAASIIPLEDHQEKFWATSARNLLTEIYERTKTNQEVWWATSKMETDELRKLLRDSLFSKYFDSEKTFASIIASATCYTRFYSQLNDKPNNLDFTDWANSNDKRSLFLPLFERDAELYKPLYSMVFELVIRGLLSNVERKVKTAIIIDELGALQKLDSLSRLLAEGRKFQACPIIATQTTAQIDKIYGRNERQILLQGTASKLILNCRDPDSARTMAEIIGNQEVLEEFGDRTGHKTSIVREKPAVMSAEIQNLPALSGFLIVGSGTPVVKAEVAPQDYRAISKKFVRAEGVNQSESRQEIIRQLLTVRNEKRVRQSIEPMPLTAPLCNISICDRSGLLLTAILREDNSIDEVCTDIDIERGVTADSSFLIWKVKDDSVTALIQVASINQVVDSQVTTYPVIFDRISHLSFYWELQQTLGHLTFVDRLD